MNIPLLLGILLVVVGLPVGYFLLGRRAAQQKRAAQAGQQPEPNGQPKAGREPSVTELARKFHRTRSLEVLAECVTKMMPSLGEGEVATNENDREVEWRGERDGHVARIRFAASTVTVEVKQREDAPEYCLEFDPSKAPTKESSTWDDTDDVRVFVGEAVFMSGPWGNVQDEARAFASLPLEERGEMVEMIRSAHARFFRSSGGLVTAIVYDPLQRPGEFERKVVEALSVATKAANLVGARESAELPPTLHLERRTCAYCSAEFFETAKLACPNCGGPIEGG